MRVSWNKRSELVAQVGLAHSLHGPVDRSSPRNGVRGELHDLVVLEVRVVDGVRTSTPQAEVLGSSSPCECLEAVRVSPSAASVEVRSSGTHSDESDVDVHAVPSSHDVPQEPTEASMLEAVRELAIRGSGECCCGLPASVLDRLNLSVVRRNDSAGRCRCPPAHGLGAVPDSASPRARNRRRVLPASV